MRPIVVRAMWLGLQILVMHHCFHVAARHTINIPIAHETNRVCALLARLVRMIGTRAPSTSLLVAVLTGSTLVQLALQYRHSRMLFGPGNVLPGGFGAQIAARDFGEVRMGV
jgi:hypothetical protein